METANSAPPKQSIAIAVPTVVLVVAATAVGLRFYVRRSLLKNVGADDWAVAMAYVGNVSHPPCLSPACRSKYHLRPLLLHAGLL